MKYTIEDAHKYYNVVPYNYNGKRRPLCDMMIINKDKIEFYNKFDDLIENSSEEDRIYLLESIEDKLKRTLIEFEKEILFLKGINEDLKNTKTFEDAFKIITEAQTPIRKGSIFI